MLFVTNAELTHPVTDDLPRYMLRSCPQPAVHAHPVPAIQTMSRVKRARGNMSALPVKASTIVPTESPSKLLGSTKFLTSCGRGDNANNSVAAHPGRLLAVSASSALLAELRAYECTVYTIINLSVLLLVSHLQYIP